MQSSMLTKTVNRVISKKMWGKNWCGHGCGRYPKSELLLSATKIAQIGREKKKETKRREWKRYHSYKDLGDNVSWRCQTNYYVQKPILKNISKVLGQKASILVKWLFSLSRERVLLKQRWLLAVHRSVWKECRSTDEKIAIRFSHLVNRDILLFQAWVTISNSKGIPWSGLLLPSPTPPRPEDCLFLTRNGTYLLSGPIPDRDGVTHFY